jgi:hypothetical protein
MKLKTVMSFPDLTAKQIASRGKIDTSIMPEGLVNNLTIAELASLLAYFDSIKPK